MVYTVLQTASRGGALALVVAALACLWQLGVKQRRLYLFLLIPIAGIVVWLYSGDTLRARFEETETEKSASSRITDSNCARCMTVSTNVD